MNREYWKQQPRSDRVVAFGEYVRTHYGQRDIIPDSVIDEFALDLPSPTPDPAIKPCPFNVGD